MSKTLRTAVLGYPRIGEQRQLKRATESYWKGDISQEELLKVGSELRNINWKKQQDAGISSIACNDFSYYDQMLDMSCLLGNVPARFNWSGKTVDLDTLFLIARGKASDKETFASEMTKWFDTNYHYLVPEFNEKTTFKISTSKVFDDYKEAKAAGFNARPVLKGPVTYLKLGKEQNASEGFDKYSLFDALVVAYKDILSKLEEAGASSVQIDEPILAIDLTTEEKGLITKAYDALSNSTSLEIVVATYFGELRDNKETFFNLPVSTLHYDAVRGVDEISEIISTFPANKTLQLGIVNGRNIWKNNYEVSLSIINKAVETLGADRVVIASASSLQHSPITLNNESKLDAEIKNWMSFADQKLNEISDLATLALEGTDFEVYRNNKAAHESRATSTRIHVPAVKERLSKIKDSDFDRDSIFADRQVIQQDKLKLPLFPTTTIGSFPQTKEVRQKRLQNKRGELSDQDYDTYLKAETEKCVRIQEDLDIDMLVHGEFERNDMVEYFGEQLEGYVFTEIGWVQSYGSRYVKPPIIFGDVSRPKAMTVYWSEYAQSITNRAMKGMLTGPITILQWSFVRDDQSRKDTTMQIGLAIRDEVVDLETAGIAAIQIDEPAIREGLPLRRADWDEYLDWAVKSFRLSAAGVKDSTQIHTHMCYSEFNDIIQAIADLDADVISIETSRSNMELLEAFVTFEYPNEIGPGVYDIHSPRVPSVQEMFNLLEKANDVLPTQNIWVNPDCGLKTRGWDETIEALRFMVDCAKQMRERVEVTAAA